MQRQTFWRGRINPQSDDGRRRSDVHPNNHFRQFILVLRAVLQWKIRHQCPENNKFGNPRSIAARGWRRQWLWHSWQSVSFWYQRTQVQIPSLSIKFCRTLFTIFKDQRSIIFITSLFFLKKMDLFFSIIVVSMQFADSNRGSLVTEVTAPPLPYFFILLFVF